MDTTAEDKSAETLDENNPSCGDGLVVEIIGAGSVTGQATSFDLPIVDLLSATRNMPLQGLTLGLANITKMVDEPKTMEGIPVNPGAILISPDGQGVSLCSAYNMNADIPFSRLIAMVERMFIPNISSVVIQEHATAGIKQSAKRQILGQINPYYSMLTVYQSFAGDYLTESKAAESIQHFYVDRQELTHYYIIAKLHLQGLKRRDAMDTYILGWNGFDIPHAIDVQQDALLKERMKNEYYAENQPVKMYAHD